MYRPLVLLLCKLSVGIVVLSACAAPVAAQQAQPRDRTVPREDYFLALRGFYTGEYRSALTAFKRVANGGIRSTEGRWVDSICYHTMAGECYYHLGQPALALEQYEAALELAERNKEWMLRVQFPDTIGPAASRARATWGASARRSVPGNFPETMMSFQGQVDNSNVIRNGGVVTQAQFFPLRVNEIVRCTGLSLYRRWELLGPVGAHSPISKKVVDTLSTRKAPANHWSQVWIEAELGFAQAANGKRAEAITHLSRAAVVGGEYDHPLTPLVLLALGKLHLEDNRLEPAANFFLEATLAGADFDQPDVMDEAFRYGLTTHLAAGAKIPYPPLIAASQWARSRGFDALQASLLVTAAESYAAVGDVRAVKAADEAKRALNRSDMRVADVGARLNYALALIGFQQGNAAAGTSALDEALLFQKKASPRLLQIGLADAAYTSGSISPRVAKDLFGVVLRDPSPADWTLDPLDTMAVTLAPVPVPMEHWFLVALERKEVDFAIEVTERMRRRKFLSTLPLGGRMLALRWILEAPKEALPAEALVRRQDLLVKYPRYAELQKQSDAARAEIAALPVSPTDAKEIAKQKKLYEAWAKIAAQQESLLGEIAVRREAADIVFPPLRKTADIQAAMPERQKIIAFWNTSRGMTAFVISKEGYDGSAIAEPAKIVKTATELFKAMGHHDGNQTFNAESLRDDAWKKPAQELFALISKGGKPGALTDVDELVIVPDGLLWYVPFEALQVPGEAESVPLISKVRIRYAPTIGLSLPDARGTKIKAKTVVVAGKLFPRDDVSMAQEAIEEIASVLPDTTKSPDVLPAPSSLAAKMWDRLIVLDDLDTRSAASLAWSPIAADKGKPGSKLADWLTLPFGGPEQVVLPGFHTPAESGLKRGANGDEMFLTLCALMSTGTRTVLMTRWRTGGQSSYDLVREFVQELPRTAASNAWQRSVQLLMSTDIDTEREPRAKLSVTDDALRAEHPLFWAGYLLADTGSSPLVDEPDAAPPAAAGERPKVIIEVKPRP